MPSGLRINPDGETVVVTITAAGSGAAVQLYSDANATTTTTNPVTITDPITVYVRETVQANVSLKINNVEYATRSGTTLPYTFADGGVGSAMVVPRASVDTTILAGTTELGYAERTSNDTTTNTDYASSISNKISGLSVTVVGQGLPVLVEFFSAGAFHSVAGTATDAVLVINGALTDGQVGAVVSSSTSAGGSLLLRRRLVLTAGTSYTFEVGKWVAAAGTGTFLGNAAFPMHLSVTR